MPFRSIKLDQEPLTDEKIAEVTDLFFNRQTRKRIMPKKKTKPGAMDDNVQKRIKKRKKMLKKASK